jgi:uncharacterized protein (TIGR04222 family)
MRDWGFFLLYAVTTLGAYLAARAYSRRLRAGPVDTTPPESYALAYLAVSDVLVMYAGYAALRTAGAISATTDGRLEVDGPIPQLPTEYERAMYEAIAAGSVPPDHLLLRRQTRPALGSIVASLSRDGWLLSGHTTAAIRRAGALIGVLAALGGVLGFWRFAAAGDVDGPGVGYIWVALAAAAGAALLRRPPHAVLAVPAMLAAERARCPHLAPEALSGWPASRLDAARAVALFGPGVIWAADPAFAERADIPHRPPSVPTVQGGIGVPWDVGAGDGGSDGGTEGSSD